AAGPLPGALGSRTAGTDGRGVLATVTLTSTVKLWLPFPSTITWAVMVLPGRGGTVTSTGTFTLLPRYLNGPKCTQSWLHEAWTYTGLASVVETVTFCVSRSPAWPWKQRVCVLIARRGGWVRPSASKNCCTAPLPMPPVPLTG